MTIEALPAAPYPSDLRAKGWRFEIDYERIAQSDTWALAQPEMRPWLLMLWTVAWQQTPCGSMSADDELIAARIGMDLATFMANRKILMRGWWKADDGRLYHPVISEQVVAMLLKKRSEGERKAEYRARLAGAHPANPDVPRDNHGTSAGRPRDNPGTTTEVPRPSGGSDDTGTGTGTGSKNTPPAPKGEPDGFDEFYSAYPRKEGRADAAKAFKKVTAPLNELLAALSWQRNSHQWTKDGGQFVPLPATWLKGQRWKDEQPAPQPEDAPAWYETRPGVEVMAASLNIGPWVESKEQYPIYKERVMTAAKARSKSFGLNLDRKRPAVAS